MCSQSNAYLSSALLRIHVSTWTQNVRSDSDLLKQHHCLHLKFLVRLVSTSHLDMDILLKHRCDSLSDAALRRPQILRLILNMALRFLRHSYAPISVPNEHHLCNEKTLAKERETSGNISKAHSHSHRASNPNTESKLRWSSTL